MLFPQVLPEMLQADFWISRLVDPDNTILRATEIAAYNQTIHHNLPAISYDLSLFPTCLSRIVLETWLTATALPTKPLYLNDKPLTHAYYEALQTKLNLKDLSAQNQVQYGFTVSRTNIRTFPTADLVLEECDHPECDYFQETGLNPAEPVVILHQSTTADWSYIQTGNYRGWTPTATLTIAASRRQWLAYLQSKAFLVVTGSNLTIPSATEAAPYYFEMGARLPLATDFKQPNGASYPAILPTPDRQNRLQFRHVPISATASVHFDYLNYTRANLLRQAFKFCGQPYDWGGLQGGVDCSGLILNLYRCFGFTFPRNAGEQEQLPGRRLELESLSVEQKKAALADLLPGATLYMNGHVMLYLGTVNDTIYILHALSSYGERDESGNMKKRYHLQVTVTDLSLLRATGRTFLETLTGAVAIE
jgi:cell wall-associated NlpC family hydrolase